VRINCSLGRCEDGTVLHCIAWRCSATPRRDVQLAVGAAFFGSIRGSPSFSARVYKAELPSYETPLTDSLALARQPQHPAPSTRRRVFSCVAAPYLVQVRAAAISYHTPLPPALARCPLTSAGGLCSSARPPLPVSASPLHLPG
jgi:hypothetical protein